MYLKKIGKVFTSKFFGAGPSSYKKRIYRAAVSQRLRNTALWSLYSRSQWPRCLRRRSSAVRLLRLWVRIPPGAWMFVCCECCVLSGRGLCDGLITCQGESYRLWRVIVCNQEASKTRRQKPAIGL